MQHEEFLGQVQSRARPAGLGEAELCSPRHGRADVTDPLTLPAAPR